MLLIVYRYQTGKNAYYPLSYEFAPGTYQKEQVDAPILIVGDRLGDRLAKFKEVLSEKVSEGLTIPIKIETIAAQELGLHRTLHKVKQIPKLPLIIIYLGGSEEYLEKKYHSKDLDAIKGNIEMFGDIWIQSILMILPEFGRVIYSKVDTVVLDEKLLPLTSKLDDNMLMQHNEVDYYFYQYEFSELVSYIKDRNGYLIALTSPINLDIPPRKACAHTNDPEGQQKLDKVLELVKAEDFKGAYRISKELSLMASSNATVHYVHGKVCKHLGKYTEAIKSLELAASFDCNRWRATPVHNSILKTIAAKEDVALYDFNQMLYDHWTKNVTYQDAIFPQDYFMEKMVTTLAVQIKKLLKL